MKIIDQIKSKKILTYIAILIVGILIGWIVFGGSDNGQSADRESADEMTDHEHAPGTIWTCSMHPQIQLQEPGQCPICGMDLIPLEEEESDDGEASQYTVRLTDAAMKIAEVSTARVEKKSPYKEVYLPGKVQADERRIAELTARFPGRIEKLNVNFTGQKVSKGQILARIYSPELVTAQKELFEAMKYRDTNPKYYDATRHKLKLWDLTEAQIDEIEETGEVMFYFNVLSPLSGTVTIRHVSQGDYVKEGTTLFKVINLNHVWVVFDAYESDLPWIKRGDKIRFTIKSIPGRVFESTVTFIDPVINPMTRVTGIRTELDNRRDLLKPQMLASGVLKTMLPGDQQLVIPKSAVLWTGKKAVVYVKSDDRNNLFNFREIVLGAEAGDYYVVEEGLMQGELVAANGVFKIDAAAQLRGERSMMNPEGGKVSMAHDHGSMDMSSSESTETEIDHSDHQMTEEGVESMEVDPAFREQLTRVYEKYLSFKNALVNSDPDVALNELQAVKTALEETEMNLLKGDAHMVWMDQLNAINEALGNVNNQANLEFQRRALAPISDALYKSISRFGVNTEKVYYQYCPMAIENQGAYWLSEIEDINNPYFGEAMLKCGETREVIQ